MTGEMVEFLLACIADDEAAARLCAEMFPPPWEVADRGWRVRVYASDVPIPDLMSDDEGAMTVRNPVVMEVEPDRKISDPRWLSERVEHVTRHDPARVLAECESKRRLIRLAVDDLLPNTLMGEATDEYGWTVLELLLLPFSDRPGYRQEWTP